MSHTNIRDGNELRWYRSWVCSLLLLVGRANQFSQCHGIDSMSYSITHFGPQIFDTTRSKKTANLGHFAFGRADHGCYRPLQDAQYFAHGNVCRVSTQPVATMSAACAGNQRRVPFTQPVFHVVQNMPG